jgi:methionine synthase / methylenetetrahydrofolate reductase(NADPH)
LNKASHVDILTAIAFFGNIGRFTHTQQERVTDKIFEQGGLIVSKWRLTELLTRQVVLGDGAMGTMLYNQGVFVNRCFDALNIESPDIVKGIHAEYVRVGADFIETNTFGANEYRLSKYGLANEVQQINRAAVEIAREVAAAGVLVAGAIGPLGTEFTEYGRMTEKKAGLLFGNQAQILIDAGVDFLILETFSNTGEILAAIRALADLTDMPIVAQMAADQSLETMYGEKIDQAIECIAREPNVTAVGLNCSLGPSGMLAGLEMIRQVTDKPLSIQPNAGLPKRVEDRTLYMSTPEYMAEYAKRFFESGARIIGGCCGTTPDHIHEMVRAVRSLDKAMTSAAYTHTTVVEAVQDVPKQSTELSDKSRIGKKLVQGDPIHMIEVTPPRGVDVSQIVEKARFCAQHGIDAINIPDGPRASSRLSPLVTACQIQQQVEIETVLHFCCRDRNLIGMQSDLLGASAMGLRNMLIITGDPPKLGEYPEATGVFDMDSVALTAVLRNLNSGIDVGGNPFSPTVVTTIGVGANPVATDLPREIERFKRKVEAGAEYAITQPVFDPDTLYRFLEAVQSHAIPILAGIWPFTSFKNAEFMANEVPGVSVPNSLLKRMSQVTTKEDARQLGIDIARELADAIRLDVAGFVVSAPFGNVKTALAVLD